MKKAYFIGISGKGMSATALLLRELGWEVSGSDMGAYPPVSDYLRDAHIPVIEGYRAENIPQDADIIVIGKNAKLVPETNEEVKAALESGIAIRSFPEVLSSLSEEAETIVVAGSYGKSTATALLAWCLKEAKKDPSYFIGEVVNGFATYAHLGKGSSFVLEGDEYPTSNWDSTSKFLYYHPKNVLLTSASHDHINIFPTQEDYLVPFRTLLGLIPNNGLLVTGIDEPESRKLFLAHGGSKTSYGFREDAEWTAKNIVPGEVTSFDLFRKDEKIATLKTSLLGKHNVENIVGVCAMLLTRELLSVEELVPAIATFEGVKRRLERIARSTVPVFEGFGSSRDKATSAIAAIRLHFPEKPLVIVFEPHTFGWRNRGNLSWYDNLFTDATVVFVLQPEMQGASTHEQLTHEEILARIGTRAVPYLSPKDVAASLQGDEVVLVLTSGSLEGTLPTLAKEIEGKFPTH